MTKTIHITLPGGGGVRAPGSRGLRDGGVGVGEWGLLGLGVVWAGILGDSSSIGDVVSGGSGGARGSREWVGVMSSGGGGIGVVEVYGVVADGLGVVGLSGGFLGSI